MTNMAWMILGLLGLGLIGVVGARSAMGRLVVYGGSLIVCGGFVWSGFVALTGPVQRLVLPLGLPGIGTNLRFDALSGFFLVLVGIGGAGASLFAIGYGRHEAHPERVLPFYPAFLAGMALVTLGNDAFTFLFAWELMSLTSWALVMAHHRDEGNAEAGFVYLIMATFSGLALLLAFGLLAGSGGEYAFDTIRAHHPS